MEVTEAERQGRRRDPVGAILWRAVGPELVRFGFAAAEVRADPQMEGRAGSAVIFNYENWNSGAADEAGTKGVWGAWGLTEGSRDAAVLATLGPGLYPVNVADKEGGTGVIIAERSDAGER